MNLSHEALSYVAVRLNVKKKAEGSGFLFLPTADAAYFYILTAKHCIYGEKFNPKTRNEDIRILFYTGDESPTYVEYTLKEEDKVVVDASNKPDLALIQILRTNLAALITWEIPVTYLASFNPAEQQAMFKGFPNFTNGKESRTILVTIITPDSNDKVIQTEAGTSYNAENGFAEYNVKGFSGSGLCVEVSGQIYLLGIIFKYEAPGRRFHSSGIQQWLSSKLPKINWYNTVSERLLPINKFHQNIRDAINLLGPRYSEGFTFRTLITDVFQPLAGDNYAKHLFFDEVNKIFTAFVDFQTAFRRIPSAQQKSVKTFLLVAGHNSYTPADITYNEQIKFVGKILGQLKTFVQIKDLFSVDRALLTKLGRTIYENTYALYQGLQQYDDAYHPEEPDFGDYIKSASKLTDISEGFLGYTGSDEIRLLVSPYLLISGKAGSGKSHLLADIAQSRLDAGKPTLLFLGQNFSIQEDPWQTILKFMDFNGRSEELLNLLNEKGQILGERIFIMIDAINEGQGLFIWKTYLSAFVESFESFPYVALVLSYRTTYKPVLFSDPLLIAKFMDVEHTGFAGFEVEAFQAFAKHYKVEHQGVPILTAVLGNPLFLKMLCLGLKTDPGYYYNRKIGIDRVFRYYIAHVNEQLGIKTFDYDYIKINLVSKAVKAFVAYQTEHQLTSVSYESAYMVVEDAVGRFVAKRRFLDSLISENIFIDKIRVQNRNSEIEFFVDFAYERLGDHMVAKYLLNSIPDGDHRVFEPEGILHDYISSKENQRRYQGLIEAMSIQWPERFGVEFFQALPETLTYSVPIMIGFLGSLAWRIESIDTQILDNLLQKFIERKSTLLVRYFWDTNIELTLDSSNEFNALYLHHALIGMSIPKRDELWTIYLQHQYPGGEREINPIARLLRWTWKVGSESAFESETILLAATTLTWFLTSTNRGLRDVTTKALIHLFSFHPQLIRDWMGKFLKVNDPYVLQRVYAVALGCAIKMREQKELKLLADYIYENFFDNEQVYPDILVRDYARLVIEFALNQGVSQNYDLQKVRPPYQSLFPQVFPTNEEIEAYKVLEKKGKEKNYHWSIDSILSSMVTEYGRGTSMYGDFGRYVFQRALKDWEKIDINLLSNLSVQWIFDKYQYNVEAFGEFDSNAGDNSLRIRGAQKERIGKKYQWIVFYEMLARVSDNKPFHPNNWSPKRKAQKYNGPWEPYVRDIDPTFVSNPLLKKEGFWLPKPEYHDWNTNNHKWVRGTKDLPNPVELLAATDDMNEEWLILELYGDWSNNEGKEYSFSKAYQRLWYQIRSYLVTDKSYEHMTDALKEANFMGRWMPESLHEYKLYNREFFWSPANADLNKGLNPWSVVKHQRKNIGKVAVTTQAYLWEEEFDNSKEGTVSIIKPSQFLYDLLELKDGVREGEYVNEQGIVLCFDPSVNYDAPSCLLVRKHLLQERLKDKHLGIFWTVLGEKQVINGNEPPLEISGLVKLIDNKLTYKVNINKK